MNAIFRTNFPLFLLAALIGAGCSDDVPSDVEPAQPTPGPGTLSEVTIGCQSGIGAEVRTSLGNRNETAVEVRWTTDDTFHLSVREAESGSWVTKNARFALQSFSSEWSSATFVGSVDLNDYKTDKSYDYFASAPADASTLDADGTATFTLPALQNGEFSGAYDWMTASQKGAHALEGNPHTNDPQKPYPQLTFTHRIHVLEITLADILLTDKSGATEPIEAIELTFPTAVAGQLSIAADAEASTLPTIAEGGGRTIRLEFASPKTAGDKVYAFIAPVQLPADATVAIKAFGTQGHESLERTFLKSDAAAPGLFRSGRVSPISYRVPQRRIVTKVAFSLGDDLGMNTLGEKVTKFRIVKVDDSGNPTGNPIHEFDVNAENKYVVEYEGVFSNPYSGKYKVQYCSPSTKDWALITKTSFTIDVEAEEYNQIAPLKVPYLFEEDFSNVKADDSHVNDNGESAQWLNDVNLPGWSASKWKTHANTMLELMTYISSTQNGWLGDYRKDSQHARADSPVLPLKTTKTISVTFYVSAITDADNGKTQCIFGLTKNDKSAIAGGHQAEPKALSKQVDAFEPMHESGNDRNPNAYDPKSYTIADCDGNTRLTWQVYRTNSGLITAKNFYMYLDNIKVSIKQ